MSNLKSDKINQMLRQRKAKRDKINSYRNKRIHAKFRKIQDHQQEEVQLQAQSHNISDQDRRKMEFYQQVFSQSGPIATEPKQTNEHRNDRPVESQQKRQNHVEHNNDHEHQQHQHQQTNFRNQRMNIEKNEWNQQKQGWKQGGKKYEKPQAPSALEHMENKAEKLGARKKKFIKKLDERTKKGQPVMKNYIKYALTKIEQSIVKDKIQEAKANQPTKNNKNSRFQGKNKAH